MGARSSQDIGREAKQAVRDEGRGITLEDPQEDLVDEQAAGVSAEADETQAITTPFAYGTAARNGGAFFFLMPYHLC